MSNSILRSALFRVVALVLAMSSLCQTMSLEASAETAGSTTKAEYEAKLDAIIFPRINFVGATLEEAISYLKAQAAELDKFSNQRGVNIVLKGTPPMKLITLDLRDVTLRELLRNIAELTDVRLRYEKRSIVIDGSPNVDDLSSKLSELEAELDAVKKSGDVVKADVLTEIRKKLLMELYSAKYLGSKVVPE